MARPFLDLLSGYRAPFSRLHSDRQIVAPGCFAFGVPWPWEPVPLDAVHDVHGGFQAAVAAPRADMRPALFVVTRGEPWQGVDATDAPRILRAYADEQRSRPLRIRRVSLDRVHTIILQADSGGRQSQRLLTTHGSRLLQADLEIPRTGYLHHFEHMLATWQWLG